MYPHEVAHAFPGQSYVGRLPLGGGAFEPLHGRPAAAMSAEHAAGLVSAAWRALEAVFEEFSRRNSLLPRDGEAGPAARRGGARSTLDVWGDCLSLSGDRVYAEVFVHKDLVPVVELVVGLVNAEASTGQQPGVGAALAARDEIMATARTILLRSVDDMGARHHHHLTH